MHHLATSFFYKLFFFIMVVCKSLAGEMTSRSSMHLEIGNYINFSMKSSSVG